MHFQPPPPKPLGLELTITPLPSLDLNKGSILLFGTDSQRPFAQYTGDKEFHRSLETILADNGKQLQAYIALKRAFGPTQILNNDCSTVVKYRVGDMLETGCLRSPLWNLRWGGWDEACRTRLTSLRTTHLQPTMSRRTTCCKILHPSRPNIIYIYIYDGVG